MAGGHTFNTFGPALKFHRKQARLTQDALGRQVGYSREYITYLESGKRKPDPNAIASLFIPALRLTHEPEAASQLIELAAQSRGKRAGDFGITITYEHVVNTRIETQVEEVEAPAEVLPQADKLIEAMAWYVKLDPNAALSLANAMGPFWRANGQFSEARAWLREILRHSTSAAVSRGEALMHAADFARHQGDVQEAIALFDEARQLFESQDDLAGVCEVLHQQAWAYFDTHHNRAEALDALQRSLGIARQTGNTLRIAASLTALAHMQMGDAIAAGDTEPIAAMLDEALGCAQAAGDTATLGFIANQRALLEMGRGCVAEAKVMFMQAAQAFAQAGDVFSLAWTQDGLGECHLILGELEAARACFEAGLATFKSAGGYEGALILTHHLARVDLATGQLADAAAGFLHALKISEDSDYRQMRARCIAGLGAVAVRAGKLRIGAQLLAAADALIVQLEPFLYPTDAQEYARHANEARVALGDAAFETAWAQGEGLAMSEVRQIAADLALGADPKHLSAR
jgi:tetratricopeptide (TPR) repeat protein